MCVPVRVQTDQYTWAPPFLAREVLHWPWHPLRASLLHRQRHVAYSTHQSQHMPCAGAATCPFELQPRVLLIERNLEHKSMRQRLDPSCAFSSGFQSVQDTWGLPCRAHEPFRHCPLCARLLHLQRPWPVVLSAHQPQRSDNVVWSRVHLSVRCVCSLVNVCATPPRAAASLRASNAAGYCRPGVAEA